MRVDPRTAPSMTLSFTAPRLESLTGFSAAGFHRFAYADWGDPDDTHVVVCAHGLTRNGRDFDWLAQRLAPHARVVCPDIVGRGASDWLPDAALYGYPQYLADMNALIARIAAPHARAGRPFTLDWVGTSMGGLIGMMLAAAPGTPLRRLVMNDVGPVLAREGLTRIGTYAGGDPRFDSTEAFSEWYAALMQPWGAFTPALTDDRLQHLVAHGLRRCVDEAGRTSFAPAYDPAIAAGFRGKVFERDVSLWPVWEKVSLPVLVLRGGASELLREDTAHAMVDGQPGRSLLTFDGIGHAPALASDDQIEPVARFLLEG
jgi:pimeloyl-ACP methyl ester carboxylesterase